MSSPSSQPTRLNCVRTMGTLVLHESAWWLNLANLSDREKDDILDMPIVAEGIFGSALASMHQGCEAKNKEDEALQLCLPRKPSGPPSDGARKEFPPGLQPPPPRMQKRSKPAPVSPALSGQVSCGNASSTLYLAVVEQVWARYGRASVGVEREHAVCAVLLRAQRGRTRFSARLAAHEGARPHADIDRPALACDALVGGDISTAAGAASAAPGPAVSGRGFIFLLHLERLLLWA